jgi:hypothetical protein
MQQHVPATEKWVRSVTSRMASFDDPEKWVRSVILRMASFRHFPQQNKAHDGFRGGGSIPQESKN